MVNPQTDKITLFKKRVFTRDIKHVSDHLRAATHLPADVVHAILDAMEVDLLMQTGRKDAVDYILYGFPRRP